jgi:hypothetical protein
MLEVTLNPQDIMVTMQDIMNGLITVQTATTTIVS